MKYIVAASTPTDNLTNAATAQGTEWWGKLGEMALPPMVAFAILLMWTAVFWPTLTFAGSKVFGIKVAKPLDFVRNNFKGVMIMGFASAFMFIPNAIIEFYQNS